MNRTLNKIIFFVFISLASITPSSSNDPNNKHIESFHSSEAPITQHHEFSSERLNFRLASSSDDLDHIIDTIKDPEDLRFMWGEGYKLDHIKTIYERRFTFNQINKNRTDIQQFLVWIIEDKETKDYIGYAGISIKKNGYLQDIIYAEPSLKEKLIPYRNKKIGKFYLSVHPSKRKKGFAYEMEKTILDHLLNNKKIDVVFHTCVDGNIASKQLATKLGFAFQGKFEDAGQLENVFTITQNQYKSIAGNEYRPCPSN